MLKEGKKNSKYKKELKKLFLILKTKNEQQLLVELEKYSKKQNPDMKKLEFLEEELKTVS